MNASSKGMLTFMWDLRMLTEICVQAKVEDYTCGDTCETDGTAHMSPTVLPHVTHGTFVVPHGM